MFYTDKTVKQLQQFGLTEKEARIYLASLELGPSAIQDIAKRADLNRSSVHIISDKLKEKGFLGTTRKGNKRLIFAERPEKLRNIVKEEKFQLEMKEMTLAGLIPDLENFDITEGGKPKVSFCEGEKGFFEICDRALNTAKNELLFLSSMKDFYGVTTQEYDDNYFIPTRVSRKIRIKMLVFRDKYATQFQETEKRFLREVRYLPDDYKFKSTIMIYAKEFSMITSKVPFLGVTVKSEELTETMKQVFNSMWDGAK